MGDLAFTDADFRKVYEALIVHAHRLIGSSRLARFERVATAGECGGSAEDLASRTLLQLLDPRVHSVKLRSDGTPMTVGRAIAFLKKVQRNDFIDEKRRERFRGPGPAPTVSDDEGEDTERSWTEDLPSNAQPVDIEVLKNRQRTTVIEHFRQWPELFEIVALMFEEGFPGYTNQEFAFLLSTTVSDIENRKKRIGTRIAALIESAGAA